MKKVFILIMSVLAIHFATAQKLVGTYYDWNKIHPKEQYYVNSAGQKNGTYKMYDQNGVVIKEYNYLNGLENGAGTEYAALPGNQRVVKIKMNFKNGEADGSVVQYCEYDNFKSKVQEGKYLSGKKTGLWREWWCTEIVNDKFYGVLKSVGSYKNDLMDGQWTFYSKRGVIESSGNYMNGIKTGEWKFYTSAGSISMKGAYENEKENGMWTYYDPEDSTKILDSGRYVNGIKAGAWTIYFDKDWKETLNKKQYAFYRKITFDDNGKPTADRVEDYYITGEKQWEGYVASLNPEVHIPKGVEVYYYQSGQKEIELDYEKGTKKEYYESGKTKSEGGLKDGRLSGTNKSFFSNGQLKVEGNYVEGQKDGLFKTYSENGKLVSEITYARDKEVSSIIYDEKGEVESVYDPRIGYTMKKGDIYRNHIGQLLEFIFADKVGKEKFTYNLYDTKDLAERLFGELEGPRNVAGELHNPILAKYDNQLKPVYELALTIEMREKNPTAAVLNKEKQIIEMLTKIVSK